MAELRLEVLQEPGITGDPVTVVCRRRKLSRDRFYEYRRRLNREGLDGLKPRSRRPVSSPNKTPDDLEQAICEMRRRHPRWGARTIFHQLVRKGVDAPAISTIGQVLKRNGLIEARRPRPRTTRRFERAAPNELWQIDATQVVLQDGTKAWVIDALDDHSRYLVGALACTRLDGSNAWDCLESGFVCGQPQELLSDNGVCFTGRLRGAEVAFEQAVADAGIRHLFCRPYHPQTLGKIERFHQTLKTWLLDQPAPSSIEDLQTLLDRFRTFYNHDRCHQAIGDVPPVERYVSSRSAAAPLKMRAVRKVKSNGIVACFGRKFYAGCHLAGVLVTVERTGDDLRILLGDEVVVHVELISGKLYYGPRR